MAQNHHPFSLAQGEAGKPKRIEKTGFAEWYSE
jgi:hypothetical protein